MILDSQFQNLIGMLGSLYTQLYPYLICMFQNLIGMLGRH